MGIYLNPGNDAFRLCLNDDIYIDKSGLIDFVNRRIDKSKRFICVSRPRRFGKSMAANMLSAYYSKECNSEELFKNLKIAQKASYKQHLNRYDVIFLNVQQFLRKAGNIEELVHYIEERVLAEIKTIYKDFVQEEEHSLPDALSSIYAGTNPHNGFVFIVDEWDCVFREAKDNVSAQRAYLDFLRDLFKDRTYVKVAYMTGILPIKKYGTHSALNIFDEFSMTNPDILAEYVGFTEDEVITLCDQYGKNFAEVQHWYDGYHLGDNLHIYNPKSVVDSMMSLRLKSFWTSTETYEALQVYIDINMDGLKEAIVTMLCGDCVVIDTGTFQNDMTSFKSKDDILTLLVHLGYLAYDELSQSVYIPNEEVRGEFFRAVKNGNRQELLKVIERSNRLLEATLRIDCEEVARLIEEAHNAAISPDFYNNEQALRSVIKLAYISCVDEFIEIHELPSGIGYADVVYLPRKGSAKPAMVIELKWNKSVEGAIQQIKEKKYPKVIENYGGEILLVGINYDSKNKVHECVIEKY